MSTDTNAILAKKDDLIKFSPEISASSEHFKKINRRWRGVITAGMIETGRMKREAAQLFEPLIRDMNVTATQYEQIQTSIIDAVLVEMTRKIISEINDAAGFTINILKRNLFERTADVGYLSTDEDIVQFLKYAAGNADDPGFDEKCFAVKKRLADYQYEYTVYNEIIILDLDGKVLANLNPDNQVCLSRDPLLTQVQQIDLHTHCDEDKYVETFRPTDLIPGQDKVLIYSQKIEDPGQQTPLGTLCLCFDFKDEMDRIFKDLKRGNDHIILGILDEKGQVLSSGNPDILPVSHCIPVNLDSLFDFITLEGKQYLVSIVATEGYQGFYGMTWYGFAMTDITQAFTMSSGTEAFDRDVLNRIQNFFKDLANIKKRSDNLLNDMKIDGLNGIIQAARFNDHTFVEILHFLEEIGAEIDNLFARIFGNLMQTVGACLFNDVQFRAFQGNNIADRNLYERANDVCWWALTPMFRQILTRRAKGEYNPADALALKENLQYINDLYTPYLRLVLTDASGEVVAVSDPPHGLEERFADDNLPEGQDFIGKKIDDDIVRRAMALSSSQDYCVTDFVPTPLYGARPTYIYATAVRDLKTARAVGAILIVFDAEPQFEAMLTDILPKDQNKQVIKGSFAVFADRHGKIISSTTRQYQPGTVLPLDAAFFSLKKGERDAAVVNLENSCYAMGIQVSEGYREYKKDDGYVNDIICMVFIPI